MFTCGQQGQSECHPSQPSPPPPLLGQHFKITRECAGEKQKTIFVNSRRTCSEWLLLILGNTTEGIMTQGLSQSMRVCVLVLPKGTQADSQCKQQLPENQSTVLFPPRRITQLLIFRMLPTRPQHKLNSC